MSASRTTLTVVVAVVSVWVGRQLSALTPPPAPVAAAERGGALGRTAPAPPPVAQTNQRPPEGAGAVHVRQLASWDTHVLREPRRHAHERAAVVSALMLGDTAWMHAYARCTSERSPSPQPGTVRVRLELRVTGADIVFVSGAVQPDPRQPLPADLVRCLTAALPREVRVPRPEPVDVAPYDGPFELDLPLVVPPPPSDR